MPMTKPSYNVCATPGCPVLTRRGLCSRHRDMSTAMQGVDIRRTNELRERSERARNYVAWIETNRPDDADELANARVRADEAHRAWRERVPEDEP